MATTNPSRLVPQTNKPVSPAISFFKTLSRAARFPVDNGLGAGVQRALEIMPWFPAHFRRVRGEECTEKILRDLAATTRAKIEEYQFGTRLTRRKQSELAAARFLLLPVGRGGFVQTISSITERELLDLMKAFDTRVDELMPIAAAEPSGWIQVIAELGEAKSVKIGYTSRVPDERLREYSVGSPVPIECRYRFWFEKNSVAMMLDRAISKHLGEFRDPSGGVDRYLITPNTACLFIRGLAAQMGIVANPEAVN